jgi:hypothetical protein
MRETWVDEMRCCSKYSTKLFGGSNKLGALQCRQAVGSWWGKRIDYFFRESHGSDNKNPTSSTVRGGDGEWLRIGDSESALVQV